MSKFFTLALLFIFAFSATEIYAASDDLLEVEDFFSSSDEPEVRTPVVKKTVPVIQKRAAAKRTTPLSASNKTTSKRPAPKRPVYVQTKRTNAKPVSLNKDHKTQMVIKKTITKPASQIVKRIEKVKEVKRVREVSGITVSGGFKGPYGHIIKPKPFYNPLQMAGKSGRKPVIVIDPGHGGKDRGTTGRLGTREKDITLAYGLALKRELEKSGKYRVVMTRVDDRFIVLGQRVAIARRAGGDVMISIHADSNPNRTTRGFSVYTLSDRRADYEAKKLLARSNSEEVIRGASLKGESQDVKEAIIDFAQGSTKQVSDDFARTVGKNLGRRIQALKKYNREGSLAVLTGSDIPSVLIELGYLSNDYEERLLKREDHKQKMVSSIRAAIDEYFSRFNMVF